MRRFSFPIVVLFALSACAVGQEAKLPETLPPPELVGRWLEKAGTRKGDLTANHVYCLGRDGQFLVVSRVLNEKTQRWEAPKKFYGRQRRRLTGYFEAIAPDKLRFQVVVPAMAVLPIEVRYAVAGDRLTLSNDLFDPTQDREIYAGRVGRLPGESASEFAAFRKRLESGLNGPKFRDVFRQAAREMQGHPPDDAMIANFFDHRGELEKLRQLIQADEGLECVEYKWTKPADPARIGVTPERIEFYRELCRHAGLQGCVQAFDDRANAVDFVASTRGRGIWGSSKKYVWRREAPEPSDEVAVVKDLDAYINKRGDERRAYFAKHKRDLSRSLDAYRHLEGHWYLRYEAEE